ncbi:pilus assembly protein PilP [Alteromonas sp. C1M14]|uniref:pilus assembly protein PilP n=1 Tax=Alteromonas sp. C1M14 TaxID=2841567 RepID=UPI001C0A2D2F|nr:pilus assembly protein PilP [Alteromonas sp. C1M14]MBU2978645.1 pilus assembly protein PilP [Alteromonas sp. C1M14]
MKLSNPLFMVAGLALLISGCAPQTDDLLAYTEEVRATTKAQVDPYPEFTSQPAFKYTASDLRSPFARPADRTTPFVAANKNNCIQPDFDRKKEKLEKYGLDSLTLSGTFTIQGVRWVLFKTNEGALLKARKGDHVGLFYGEIKTINDQSIIIEQLLPDGAGCWQREKTTLTMNTSAGDNKNV